jgi:hypothetical protein
MKHPSWNGDLSDLFLDVLSNVLEGACQYARRRCTVEDRSTGFELTFSMVNCSMACCATHCQRFSPSGQGSVQLADIDCLSLHLFAL